MGPEGGQHEAPKIPTMVDEHWIDAPVSRGMHGAYRRAHAAHSHGGTARAHSNTRSANIYTCSVHCHPQRNAPRERAAHGRDARDHRRYTDHERAPACQHPTRGHHIVNRGPARLAR